MADYTMAEYVSRKKTRETQKGQLHYSALFALFCGKWFMWICRLGQEPKALSDVIRAVLRFFRVKEFDPKFFADAASRRNLSFTFPPCYATKSA
jgi:hypothetical protein